jgi:hypothetical protein
MRIEGVDDQLQELIDFGLKFTFRHRPIINKTKRKDESLNILARFLWNSIELCQGLE